MKKILLFLLRIYQRFISPLKPTPTCIYTPCCSEYARQAITKYGACKGGFLALKRILRCHPFLTKVAMIQFRKIAISVSGG